LEEFVGFYKVGVDPTIDVMHLFAPPFEALDKSGNVYGAVL